MATTHAFIGERHIAVGSSLGGADAREVGCALLEALDGGIQSVIIDCREWRHLDFVLLSALVKCADVFSRLGASLELVNLSSEMRMNIRELQLQDRLQVLE